MDAELLGYSFVDTQDGRIVVVASRDGVAYVGWGATDDALLADARARLGNVELVAGKNGSAALAKRVAKLADRPGASGAPIPLDLRGTEFQREVWAVLASIPAGSTMSYGEVAAAVGRPGASRAVGSACGANPAPIVVPCHRVIAADGGLGGFSGELWRKKAMLHREGAR